MKREIRECLTCGHMYCKNESDLMKHTCPNCAHRETYIASIEEDELNPDRNDEEEQKFADRFNAGKLQWSMVDFKSLEDMVRVLEFGAKKYSRNNWKKGLKTTEIVDSMLRHIYAYLDGEDVDPESGINHTGHIMCNAMFLSHMHLFRKDMDTRCKTLSKE